MEQFLKTHSIKKDDKSLLSTHTRIGCKEPLIFGGSYNIESAKDIKEFHKLYYNHIFVKKNKEYLTERQIQNSYEDIIKRNFSDNNKKKSDEKILKLQNFCNNNNNNNHNNHNESDETKCGDNGDDDGDDISGNRREEKKDIVYGPLLIDFDFRYDVNITTRQHTDDHIVDIINEYLEVIKQYLDFSGVCESENESKSKKTIPIYVFEKPNVNILKEDKEQLTKDGIHMIFGIQMDHILQQIIREKMITKLASIITELPLKNTWEEVLDKGISMGTTNWQLYGSCKPQNETYKLVKHYEYIYAVTNNDSNGNGNGNDDGDLVENELKANSVIPFNLFEKLTAQYTENMYIPVKNNANIIKEYEKMYKSKSKSDVKKRKLVLKPKKMNNNIEQSEKNQDEMENDCDNDNDDDNDDMDMEVLINTITDKQTLENATNKILNGLRATEYEIRELHQYVQLLPEKYYKPGSHLLNRQVAFALKNTDERLFLSWVMLRSKASDFEYSAIPQLYFNWRKHFNKDKSTEGITKRSILYWVKQDAAEEYEKVKHETISYYIEQSLIGKTEYDIAVVLYHLFKDKYVCSSVEKKTWYYFVGHRWKIDRGTTLRPKISKELYQFYANKQMDLLKQEAQLLESHHSGNGIGAIGANGGEEGIINLNGGAGEGTGAGANDKEHEIKMEQQKKKLASINALMMKLKKTADKNNIIREAMDLFYDEEFERKIDTNKELLCFTNGVVDFQNKIFRDGYPQDYITKTTNIEYIHFNSIKNTESLLMVEQVREFMRKLFPVVELNKYMWEHLASCLIGTNLNQTFNIYLGNGSNGKSLLTDLMKECFGEYYGKCPIELVTGERTNIGGTSSEVANLKGIRYAVMQEPKKSSPLNEGIMKELTGDSSMQARQLYRESEVFDIQFKLIVATNYLFEMNTMDDGTWRRIRICDFMSKFAYKHEMEDMKKENKYVYERDDTFKDKLPELAPFFMSMLVDLAFKTNGKVQDCEPVLTASRNYRKTQDFLNAFFAENIEQTNHKDDKIKKNELMNHFREWYKNEQGGVGVKKLPKAQEIYDAFTKKYGALNKTCWLGVKILYPDSEDINKDVEEE